MTANLTTRLGQLVDVLTPDTTNTRIGVANASPTRTLDVTGTGAISTSLAIGGATIGTNALAVTGTSTFSSTVTNSGATTLSGALTYGGVTLSNAVTGTGNMVLSASPTLSGTVGGALTFSGALTLSSALTYGGVTLSNAVTGTGKMVLDTSPTFTTQITAPDASTWGTSGILGAVRCLVGGTSITNACDIQTTFNGGTRNGLGAVDTSNTNGAQLAKFFITASTLIGSITNNSGTGVLYNVTSDKNLKNDLGAIDTSSIFEKLQTHSFSWKVNGKIEAGFFAQEVFEHIPYAVKVGKGVPGDDDYEPWAMDKSMLVPHLWAEVASLRARVTALEAKVN